MRKQIISFVLCLSVATVFTGSGIHAQTGSGEDEPPFIYGGIAWSPEGDRLAVGTSNGVWLHSTEDLSILSQLNDTRFIQTLHWSHSGDRIALGNVDGNTEIWDAATGQLLRSFEEPERRVWSVRWSPDDQLLASASSDQMIHVWDASSGTELHTISIEGFPSQYAVFWYPDGQQITTPIAGSVLVWDIESEDMTDRFDDLLSTNAFVLSPDGELFAVAVRVTLTRFAAQLWNTETHRLEATLELPELQRGSIFAMAWSPDSSQLALYSTGRNYHIQGELVSEDDGGMLQVWDVPTRTIVAELSEPVMTGDSNLNNAIAWSPDGSRLASISDDGHIYIWDAETFELLASYDGYRPILMTDT